MTEPAKSAAEQCLRLIAYGIHQRKFGDANVAARALGGALLATHSLPGTPEQGQPLRALALYNLSLIQLQGGRAEEARQLREYAAGFLAPDAGCAQIPPALLAPFQELMAEILVGLGEHRRAIPYCEAVLAGLANSDDPPGVAAALARAGRAYLQTGLRDHAAVHLRAAVEIYRTLAGEPRLSAVLIDLGNALRKSAPGEAQRCYEEAAGIHVSRAQMESATAAWINLGVMCNEQGRHAEALACYEKALHVRENAPGTPAARLGTLHNNIANAHRRMKNFDDALRSADRALMLLESSGGHSLACAYGTRGLIFRDQGRDQEAVEWFRKSSAEHRKQPSPNLETLSEELDNEAAALARLGRMDEAARARSDFDSVRAALAGFNAAQASPETAPASKEGAVLIELDFGSRAPKLSPHDGSAKLRRRLSAVVGADGTGWLGGYVVIPETTTLLFYGADGEALFRSLHPALLEEPAATGARITVRQGARHRAVLLPRRAS